jgi:Leucine-rich repeat (LRR) protein
VLQNFSISNNLVPTIHHSIENWAKHLIYLDISNNRIESIATITKMCGLRTLLIQSNEFKVLTYTLSKLSMLRELSLDWFKYTNPPMASV